MKTFSYSWAFFLIELSPLFFLFFFPVLLRYNLYTALYKFKVCSIVTWLTYIMKRLTYNPELAPDVTQRNDSLFLYYLKWLITTYFSSICISIKYMRNKTHRMESAEGKEVKLKTFEQSWFEQKMDLNSFLIEI